jgi:hypothetical protein
MSTDPLKLALLQTSLCAAVPLHVFDMKQSSWAELEGLRQRLVGEDFALKMEHVLFRGKPGQTSAAFGELARAVALLSFAPGGLKFLGLRWRAHHPEVGANDGTECFGVRES